MGRNLNLKRITTMSLATLLALSAPYATMAQSSNGISTLVSANPMDILSQEKADITYLKGQPGDLNLVYTYKSNGSTYKVIENTSNAFDKVDSIIYKQDTSGNFVEYATQNLTIANGQLFTLKTTAGGESKTEIQTVNVPTKRFMARASYNGTPVSPWWYDWSDGSTKILNWTVSAVTAAIVVIAGANVGVPSQALLAAAGVIADKIIGDRIPILYYEQKYGERTSVVVPSMVVVSSWDTWWYGDSKFTDYVGKTFEKVALAGYVD